ncbi:hypothetical protein [Paraglaciecola hydrolytica]|uniref:DUF4397 domain-containing protein n=1 Tax=Paraglaciecola hydrolytica TaxID=1799789 RepID=A0A136A6U6_9ALTE|nr:hypothetical protein [Paraglaciecola hydrolytica]KXI30941.1 hypothetical protein AX660_00285 [Paraglaciecola hydrolytica]
MIKLFLKTLAYITFSLALLACGSSKDKEEESTYSEAYLQFYNGSATSALTYLREVDGQALGSAVYGDATSLLTVESGEMALKFYRQDTDNKEILIEEMQSTLKKGEKSLMILSGSGSAQNVAEHKFVREELSAEFRLFSSSVIEGDSRYDLYLADEGDTFSEAHKLNTLAYQDFSEVNYWGATSADNFKLGSYVVYLTLPGQTEPVFQSAPIAFSFTTEYVLLLRATAGANSGNIEVDVVANSSTVTTYSDVNESAQYRIYNSLPSGASLHVTLDGSGNNSSTLDVAAKTLSDFTDMNFGNYRLSAELVSDASISFNNNFVTLNQGTSKAIILYQNANNELKSLAFNESTLPQSFQFQVEVVNLLAEFSSLELYFVRAGETLDNAKYVISALNFAKSKSITLPDDTYEILALVTSNGTQLLLDRSEQVEFEQGKNHIISIEKDDTSVSGYKIRILN